MLDQLKKKEREVTRAFEKNFVKEEMSGSRLKNIDESIKQVTWEISNNEYSLGFGLNLFFICIYIIGFIFIWVAIQTVENLILTLTLSIIPAVFICIGLYMQYNSLRQRKNAPIHLNELKKEKEKIISNLKNSKNKYDKLKKELSMLETKYHKKLVSHFTKIYDKNKNGVLDVIEDCNDYLILLKKNQDKIIKISENSNQDYMQTLVKLDEKLNLKKNSLNKTLKEILIKPNKPYGYISMYDNSRNIETFEEFLSTEIHTYNVILANALLMVNSLINNDRITFFKIYEKFDNLNMFNSNYENKILEILDNAEDNLINKLKSINSLYKSVTSTIENLNHYFTEKTITELSNQLKKLNSSIDFNTLISSINAYQNYKTNKNTKSLR